MGSTDWNQGVKKINKYLKTTKGGHLVGKKMRWGVSTVRGGTTEWEEWSRHSEHMHEVFKEEKIKNIAVLCSAYDL